MKCLNGFQLKVFAIILMTIDHVGAILYPYEEWFRIVGRLAFPIFAFLCVEGMLNTKDVKKYMLRMAVFAVISEIPFDLAIYGKMINWGSQSIFLTLLIGLICIYILQDEIISEWQCVLVFLISYLGELLNTDYGMVGVWLLIGLYLARDKWWKMLIVLIVINNLIMGGIQIYGTLAIIPILLYNDQRGYKARYLFYIYYPLHLIILYGIDKYIM